MGSGSSASDPLDFALGRLAALVQRIHSGERLGTPHQAPQSLPQCEHFTG